MKKGQGGGGAGVLILVIAAFIILYILFLPPDARDELLDRDSSDGSGSGFSRPDRHIRDQREIVVDENPGILQDRKEERFEHRIDSFNLFTVTKDVELKVVQSASIYSRRGEEKSKSIPLIIPPKSRNVQLSLNVRDHKDRLIILLNDDEIFSGEVTGVFNTIRLEKFQQENVLEFKTDSVGWMFWRKNFYDLTDIKVTGTVDDISTQESRSIFIIGEEEKREMEAAFLIYFVDCAPQKVDKLTVYMNDRILSSRVPDCGSPAKIPVDPADLFEGKNELRFFATQGSFLVDQVQVKTELKEPLFPIYFFDVNETQFVLVQNRSLDAHLQMTFVDDGKRKAATLNINNIKLSFDEDTTSFNRSINEFIVLHDNFIRIEPRNTFSIVNLRIELK